jgi:primosomal protein N' (replication factor Y) (superfamily II helicase)
VGSRVRVPFHGRRVGAWVAEVDVVPPPGVVVREITRLSGFGPPPPVLRLATWAAWRWAMPPATLLRTASPERNVWTLPPVPAAAGVPPAVAAPEAVAPPPAVVSPAVAPAAVTSPAVAPAAVVSPASALTALPATLRRLPPAQDLLPLVLDMVDAAAGPVLVLVPSTGWAERLASRLRARRVAVASDWAEAAAGWPVVVGSRAAAWSPVPRLGAALVLDAHDYHDRYDAAEVVAQRAAADGAPCLLVSPCPTAVQVFRHGPPIAPDRAVERSGWPAVAIADRRSADPRTGLLSEELVQLAHRVLPDRLVCVLNRTGRARLLACGSCGALARCERCGRAVELADDVLRCRACGAERPLACAACGSARLKVLRQGVTRVREEMEALLGTPVGEVSGEATCVPDTSVLVGTEAVLHRVRHAAAVAFLDYDQHLLAPRFAAGEESLALLARAGRLVGGRDGGGVVLVQTRLPEHNVLRAAVAGDPGVSTELELRRELALPPFSALATVRSPDPPELAGVEVSPLDRERWLVRAPNHEVLCDALVPLHGGARVDPVDV